MWAGVCVKFKMMCVWWWGEMVLFESKRTKERKYFYCPRQITKMHFTIFFRGKENFGLISRRGESTCPIVWPPKLVIAPDLNSTTPREVRAHSLPLRLAIRIPFLTHHGIPPSGLTLSFSPRIGTSV